ncbi:MAG TPA: hypothetical protein EYP28_04865 [Methanophagales archaeon]|nr:hypothetical protein [Methanophagales archaeon]
MADASDLKSVSIRVTKGNGLTDFITEDFQAGKFQSTLAAGVETTKAVRLQRTVAALGTRGDYLEMVLWCTVGEAGEVPNVNTCYIEAVDYTGVPSAVQHTVFGKYSPFISPKESMNESMLDGIDRQEIAVQNTEAIESEAACSTPKAQLVRGSSDSRVDYAADHADIESMTYLRLKFKPNSDGVFMFRAGAVLWADPDTNALG